MCAAPRGMFRQAAERERDIAMLHIGCHVSSAKGYLAMGKDAEKIGANTLQFFLRNPRGGAAKAIVPEDVAAYLAFAEEHGIGQIMAHASYTLNPATADAKLKTFVRNTIKDDLERMELTPGNLYNLHPGTAKNIDKEEAFANVAAMLDAVMTKTMRTTITLETMSGRGNEVGGTFEDLRRIIDECEHGELLGVCLDTCHVFSAGYDIAGDLDGVLKQFDKTVGLDRLKGIHLNDSMFALGRGKDRHAKLGEGALGLDAFRAVINHPALRELPFLLETPNELDGYAHEIALLKSLYGDGKRAAKPVAKPAAKKVAKK